jgi:hypothetical protein
MIQLLVFSFFFIAVAIMLMAIGVMLKRRPIQGSCGGMKRIASLGGIGLEVQCEFCPPEAQNQHCHIKHGPQPGATVVRVPPSLTSR